MIVFNILFYRNELCFCGLYGCVNAGESLTTQIKSERLYVKFLIEGPALTHRENPQIYMCPFLLF